MRSAFDAAPIAASIQDQADLARPARLAMRLA